MDARLRRPHDDRNDRGQARMHSAFSVAEGSLDMKWLGTVTCVLGAAALAGIAWAGHELPIYPSFYPHEIEIRSLAPEAAAPALRDGKIQAYIGRGLSLSRAPGADIRAVESLGSFILVRANPASARAQNACAVAETVMRALA